MSNDTQVITVGNAVGHTQGIKPTAQEEYFEFDEENSPYNEKQMARFISNNIDEGDEIELVLSPDNEGEFVEVNMNPGSNGDGGKSHGSQDGAPMTKKDKTINRQSAVKSVSNMWDERPKTRQEWKRFKGMVKDVENYLNQEEFLTGDDDIFVHEKEDKKKVQKNDEPEEG